MRPDPKTQVRQRLEQARKAKAAPEEQRRARELDLQRIDLIGRAVRDNWYGLLFYLTFVGITLLGIRDVDFFMPEKDTALPVLQVSIPTLTLFTFAPMLGAALFVNLHLQLVKYWESLSEADQHIDNDPLSDHIAPRLISDFALILRQRLRGDTSLRSQPMGWLLFITTAFLLFVPAPFVLAGFWARSMPAHDAVLTILLCGLPLVISIYTAWVSARHLWRVMRNPVAIDAGPKNPMGISRSTAAFLVVATVGVSGFGWLRTEGTWLTDALFPMPQTLTLIFPARADLSNAVFVETPPGWQDRARARQTFRGQWCRTEGLPSEICGPAPAGAEEAPPFLPHQRLQWCRKTFASSTPEGELAKACATHFSTADKRFDRDWRDHRQDDLAALRPRDLSGVRWEGANLRNAQLSGANLGRARMVGATLSDAAMEGANLNDAEMTKADLSGAQMEGANLGDAKMEGAGIRDLILGIDITISRVTLGSNPHADATLLPRFDLSNVRISLEQINSMFGDASVILPGGKGPNDPEWPAHWPRKVLSSLEFVTQWRAWQKSIGYVPPG